MNFNSMMRIYTDDRDTSDNPITVGYKGQTIDLASFYVPYVPLQYGGAVPLNKTTNGMLYYNIGDDKLTYDFSETPEYINQGISALHSWMFRHCLNTPTTIIEEMDSNDGRMHYVAEFTLKDLVLFKLAWL